MDVNQLQTVRRALGHAAMGGMLGPEIVRQSVIVVNQVRESGESPEQTQSLVKAMGVLDRGLLPPQDVCRSGQREVYGLIARMQERGAEIGVPRQR